jgi:hypothetical protein
MRFILISLLFVVAGACGQGTVAPEEPTQPAATEAEEEQEATDADEKSKEASAMHQRFLAVNGIRDAVIAGDLAAAKERADRLAKDKKLLSVFASWGPHTNDMRAEIQKTAEATDLGTAAKHLAAAARACGRCHAGLGVATLDEKVGEMPKKQGDIGGIMRQHHWATNNMWTGLIAPSEATLTAGSAALSEIAKNAQEQPTVKNDEQLRAMLKEVEGLGYDVTRAVTWPERTAAFGKLLATCSTCHDKMKAGAANKAAP